MDSSLATTEPFRWPSRGSPQGFLPLVHRLVPWLAAGALACCALGFCVGLLVAPVDARHGDVHRIIYIHVPATWMSVLIFMLLAFCAGVGRFGNVRLAAMMAQALAPTGAMFAFMALWTGSLWGKPIWGAWWVWDLRLAADLVLMALYLAIIAVHAGIDDARRADTLVATIALAGSAIVPAILASTVLWPALPVDPALPLRESGGRAALLVGLLAVGAGFWLYSSATALLRLRGIILERERQSDWVATCVRDGR